MEYSFENFINLGKKKNGKADKIYFTVLYNVRDLRKLFPCFFLIICLMRMSVKATLSVRHFCFEERVSTELLLEIEFVKSKSCAECEHLNSTNSLNR